jgi:hypothetical protein
MIVVSEIFQQDRAPMRRSSFTDHIMPRMQAGDIPSVSSSGVPAILLDATHDNAVVSRFDVTLDSGLFFGTLYARKVPAVVKRTS